VVRLGGRIARFLIVSSLCIGAFLAEALPVQATGGAAYVAYGPVRVADSRIGLGVEGRLAPFRPATFSVAGSNGIPADAVAVTGNLTVTQQTSLGYLYIGPVPLNDPTSSTLNFPVGDDRANGVTVALGVGGTLSVTYASPSLSATAQAIFDVTGYFVPDASGEAPPFIPLNPARLLDSRYRNGLSGAFASHVARTFQVTGLAGIPADAVAVTGNLTVTQQTSLGYLYIGPVPLNDPTSSTLNFPVGDDRANGVTVALGVGGTLSVTYASPSLSATAQAIFDVTGYFVPDASGEAPPFPGMSLYRYSAWSQQAARTWCVGAATQMMINVVAGTSDHSSANQGAYVDYAYNQSQYVARVGAEVDGWANALTHYGAGTYSVGAYGTFEAAIKAAATRMRVTGKPVGLVTMEGYHAWVMAGFTQVGEDPSVSQNFAVTAVIVMAPNYGLSAYDPAPGSVESMDYMAGKLTPYVDDYPTIWDGQYVIIQP
jgi:hypothetical protein